MIRRRAVVHRSLGASPQTATVQPIDVELHNIATLAGRRGPYAISATLTGGGVVTWEGEVSLFPLASSGHLALRDFPLATAWRFAQDRSASTSRAAGSTRRRGTSSPIGTRRLSLQVDGVDVTVADLVLTARERRRRSSRWSGSVWPARTPISARVS